MYRKITHFDLNAEPFLSEWKHLEVGTCSLGVREQWQE